LLGAHVVQYERLSRQKMSKSCFFSDISRGICYLKAFENKTHIKVFQLTEIYEETFLGFPKIKNFRWISSSENVTGL
jgi:hypothetical protein